MALKFMVIGAHNDECEYGVGGITRLLVDRGAEALFVNTSGLYHREQYTPEELATWIDQEQRSAAILGARKVMLGKHDGHICENDEAMILKVEAQILEFRPDILLIHWPEDNHLEHRISANIAYQALCIARVHGAVINEIYAFEAGPGQTGEYFKPDLAIDVTDVMDKVNECLMCYDQPCAHGAHLCREKGIHTAFRGHISGKKNAECLKIVKYPEDNGDFLLRTTLIDKFRWAGNGMYPALGKVYF